MPERIYHHYKKLEEFHCGMWRNVRGKQRIENAASAAALLRSPDRFRAALDRVMDEWPMSCQHNLTADDTNRIAWLGWAACAIECRAPEENTRLGWQLLSEDQQRMANAVAKDALNYWLAVHTPKRQLDLIEAIAC